MFRVWVSVRLLTCCIHQPSYLYTSLTPLSIIPGTGSQRLKEDVNFLLLNGRAQRHESPRVALMQGWDKFRAGQVDKEPTILCRTPSHQLVAQFEAKASPERMADASEREPAGRVKDNITFQEAIITYVSTLLDFLALWQHS